jgi:hypothetical protein
MLRRLIALHLAGNALLLLLLYYWLGVGETRASTLLWSAFLALVLVAAACWLHAAAFAYFRGAELPKAFRQALRNLLPMLAAAALIAILYAFVAWAASNSGQPAFEIASYFTLKLRKPVKPNAILLVFAAGFWLVRWMVLPVFVLPLLSGVSSRGWAGFGEVGRMSRAWPFWIAAPVLLVCAFWLPLRLVGWAPHLTSFALEMTSFVVRLPIAYLLFIGSWLLLAFFTSGGKLRA